MFSISIFFSKLCTGAENSASLFMLGMRSNAFQCKCRLFWMLRALVSVSMCAKMVHSIPPLLISSCQLHSSWGQFLRVNLYLRTFFFSSISRRCVKSAQAELWFHSVSASPMILMFNVRLGEAWFLECTSVSF